MKSKAVIGLGFGDEGKGSVTNYLCSRFPGSLVIRYSGGHQAGHTVMIKDLKHVFSNFGSGTLQGTPTYWSEYCTINPTGILNELSLLTAKGIDPILYINRDCPVTTPYDIWNNQENIKNRKHGTCGVGFGETLKREKKHYSLKYKDLFSPTILKIKLEGIAEYYNQNYIKSAVFMDACMKITDTANFKITEDIPEGFNNLIFEGSQGLLLDQNFGFFPHVTRSNTGTKNILEMGYEPDLYLVTRAYQTRHGNGPMTNTEYGHNIKPNPYEVNVRNEYQGEFRISLLDLDLLNYAINSDEHIKEAVNKHLIITCLDQMRNEYRFTYQGKIVYCNDESEFIALIATYLDIEKVLISKSPYSDKIIEL